MFCREVSTEITVLNIRCVSCTSAQPGTKHLPTLEKFIEPFLELLNSDDDAVHEAMLDALPQFIKHYPKIHKSEFLPMWFKFLTADNTVLRTKFANSVQTIIFNIHWLTKKNNEANQIRSYPNFNSKEDKQKLKCSMGLFKNLMSHVNSASNTSLNDANADLQRTIVLTLMEVGM